MNFEEKLYQKLYQIIKELKPTNGYAISFFLHMNQIDENMPHLYVSYNTENDCNFAPLISEERWNYAFWSQNTIDVIETSAEIDEALEYLKSIGVNNVGKELEDVYDESMNYIAAGPSGYKELAELLSTIAIKIRNTGVIKEVFSKEVPIIIHDLEYYDYIIDLNKRTNPEELIKDFVASMDFNGELFNQEEQGVKEGFLFKIIRFFMNRKIRKIVKKTKNDFEIDELLENETARANTLENINEVISLAIDYFIELFKDKNYLNKIIIRLDKKFCCNVECEGKGIDYNTLKDIKISVNENLDNFDFNNIKEPDSNTLIGKLQLIQLQNEFFSITSMFNGEKFIKTYESLLMKATIKNIGKSTIDGLCLTFKPIINVYKNKTYINLEIAKIINFYKEEHPNVLIEFIDDRK